jgi:acetyl-CoA acetyltransferase
MAMHDAAVIAYAETKIVEKSDRDIWELQAEVLDSLLAKTGFDKAEIDGLILSSSMTGAGNAFWSQTTADQLSLELDFCQTVDIGGCSPAAAVARACLAIDAGLCTTVLCLYADTQASEAGRRRPRSHFEEWQQPYGYLGPPAAFGLLIKRY